MSSYGGFNISFVYTITTAPSAILYSPFMLYCSSFVYLLPCRSHESLPTWYIAIELWNKLHANNFSLECKRIVVVRTKSLSLIKMNIESVCCVLMFINVIDRNFCEKLASVDDYVSG